MLVGLTVEYQNHICYFRHSNRRTPYDEEVGTNIDLHDRDEQLYYSPHEFKLGEIQCVMQTSNPM
ncbi:MAG: hypothetical protein ACK56F_15975, partial [bacterium]